MNNFGMGSPGVTTFHVLKGLLSNTSHLNGAIITKFRWLFKVIMYHLFYVCALDMKR